MNISSAIMNTSSNSFHERKKNEHKHDKCSVIQLKCTLIIWNIEGIFSTNKHKTHVFLGFTITCMLDKYNSCRNRYRFLSLGKQESENAP